MISENQLDTTLHSFHRDPSTHRDLEAVVQRVLATAIEEPPPSRGVLPHLRWRFPSLFSATRFVVAGAIVALFGGFLLVAQPFGRVDVTVPGAETEGLPPVTGPAGNGLIAFDRDGDIYVGDPATGESKVIVEGEKGWRPLFSPDGTHIAFFRGLAGIEGPCDIVVVQADGSDERVITPTDDGVGCLATFEWAPDSRSVVVEEYGEPFYPLLLLDAYEVADPISLPPVTSSAVAMQGWHEFGTDATFLRPPAGERLLLWSGTPALGIVDLDGGDVVDLGEASGLLAMGYVGFADASWSPDGSRIAVLAHAGAERHLYVMGATGSFPRRIATIAWPDDWPGPSWSWSPDGRTIAVQHVSLLEPGSREGCPDWIDPCPEAMWVTLIDVESGEARDLDSTRSPGAGDGSIWAWSWSPDGHAIVLTRESAARRPELVDIASDTATELPWDGFSSWQRVAAD